ncbi:MAG TPA: STAS domain-containing protein [Streptosporangiaceae bacterium]
MADMGFRVEEVRGVQVVVAPEEIDIINADGLRVALLEAAAHGHGTLVADMTRTRFCDSAGLNALVAAHNRARAEDGHVLLAISCTAVLRVFAITGVDRVIPNFASLDEALDVALGQAPAYGSYPDPSTN